MFDQVDITPTKTEVSQRLQYSGEGTELAILMFKNLVLTIFTLGVYAAWGRTNTRRYLWGKVSFLDDRASYTGDGKELFRGWVMIFVFYIVAAIIINVLSRIHPVAILVAVPVYIYLYALAVYGGTRYRLSRTKWRETNFALDRDKESSKEFTWLVFKGLFLSVVTLGIYFLLFENNKRRFLINKSRFGTAKFNYTSDNSEYYWLVAKNVLLCIVTFGIYSSWMIKNLMQYKLNCTDLEGSLRFRMHLKGSDLLIFSIVAYIGTILTLGLALPWVINASYKLFINATEVYGEIDFSQIQNVEAFGSAAADVAMLEYDLELGF